MTCAGNCGATVFSRYVASNSGLSDKPMATLAAVPAPPTDPYAGRERHHNEGHGRRLTAAFEALEAFPALAESRNHVLRLFESGQPSPADVVSAEETGDPLAATVLRLAHPGDAPARRR